jgi:glyoxylase-like metal-dependent hydrolase (beta-lactamase superfamily II)
VFNPVAELPEWLTWWRRPFPDCNLVLLHGRECALIDSGFVGHVEETVRWVHERTDHLARVVNTHWHADHVGGNAEFRHREAFVTGSLPDAEALARRDPGCCQMVYFDQPSPAYSIDEVVGDGDVVLLGDEPWQVVATPGHTPGHLALWHREERLLAVGDALTDFDIGMVNIALDGPEAARAALHSIERLTELGPRVLLPAHGPIPTNTVECLFHARRRARRLVDDYDGALWYFARRVFSYQLMLRDGMPLADVEPYLRVRPWLVDAARLLRRERDSFIEELVDSMLRSGAMYLSDGRLNTATEYTPVSAGVFDLRPPAEWPPPRQFRRAAGTTIN